MLGEKNIDKNLWNSIKLHYEKECYTDVVKDACLYLIEIIQDKSERNDLDGETLINTVFSEKNPKLLINNNQTISEKDEQRGFLYILRGIICGMRNPISHSKQFKYSKEESESIILFINNYILRRLDDSKDFGYTDDWFDFIFFKNHNDSKKFSDAILNKMRKKEKYDLMISTVNNLSCIETSKYHYIVNKLYNDLLKQEKCEIVVLLNKELIDVDDGKYIRSFFNHFEPTIWKYIDDLVRIRIEEIIYEEIRKGKIYYDMNGNEHCNGLLGTWVEAWIVNFSNYKDIIELLFDKLSRKEEAEYVLKYFSDVLLKKNNLKKYSKKIIKQLELGNKDYKRLMDDYMIWKNSGKDDEMLEEFKESYENFKDEDPFEDFLS